MSIPAMSIKVMGKNEMLNPAMKPTVWIGSIESRLRDFSNSRTFAREAGSIVEQPGDEELPVAGAASLRRSA